MKILFIINTLAYPGGAERVISVLANEFSMKNDVHFITSWKVNDEYGLNSNIKRINLFPKKPSDISKLKKNLKSILMIRQYIKKNDIDVIISFCTENNLRMMLATLGLKCKKIISIRNNPIYEFPNKFIRLVNYLLFMTIDYIVFQTKDAQSFFPDLIQKKGVIIYNPIDNVFFNNTNLKRRKKIVSIGRFAPQKNNIMLIEAFKKISNKVDYTVELYGEGINKELLKMKINEYGLEHQIKIFSKTNNVKEVYDSSTIYVLTSDFEGMPNSLMEAMASGLACISTDCPCGGPKTLINNNENGILIGIRNIDDLAEALLKVIYDDEFKNKLMKNAKISSYKFKIENIISEWEKIIY